MSLQVLAARMENLTILRNNAEDQKLQVYKFLSKEGVSPSQLRIYTETFADLDRKQNVLNREIEKIEKQLAV